MLLFRGSEGGSSWIRTVTGGHFDHVALIVRTAEEGVNNFSIVEAVGKIGVSATTWNEIREEIGVGKFYEKVAFRKLKCVRNDKFIKTFDSFLEEAWDHDYGIGIGKLTAKASFKLTSDSTQKYIAEGRTFFCSELVAKAYKVLGVM